MKKLMSAMLVVSMIASMSSGAFAANVNGQTIKQDVIGENDMKNPIYSYQIPLSLDFAIDAFEKGQASQVYSGAFPIINMSDVPLSVKVGAKITDKKPEVTVKDSAAAVSQVAGDSAKEVYMELVAAKTADATVVDGSTTTASLKTPKITKQADTPAVTWSDGDTTTNKANIVFDLAGLTVTDPNMGADGVTPAGGAAYTAIIKTKTGATVGFINGNAVTGADKAAPTADEVAASFKGKTFKALVGLKEVTLTETGSSGTSLTFAAADFTKYGVATVSDWTVEIVPSMGTPATAVLKTDTLVFPAYNDTAADAAIKDGANTKSKFAVTENSNDQLWYVLKNAVYENNFADATEKTLLKSLQATPKDNVGSFRLMGTVTASAPWAAEDLTVTATFDVGGIPESKTADLTALGDGQNVKVIAPSVKNGTNTPISLGSIAASTRYKVVYNYGSLMKKVAKVEIQAMGAAKTTWTAVTASAVADASITATTAGYKIDEATSTISLLPGTVKLFKATRAANFNEATMADKNQIRITYSDGTSSTAPAPTADNSAIVEVTGINA